VKIAREVEAAMQREMFTPPGGPTYIPREYIVYLSAEDDKDWQGDKRRGLEQGLFHVLSERARELSGTTQLAVKSFAVELRVDGTLNKGEFRVQAVWDETESGHTMVTPRVDPSRTAPSFSPGDTIVEHASDNSESEQTVVRPKAAPLFSVEIWRSGVREAVVPIMKNEITIGRGSRSITVDLPIKGDPEVSRVHAVLSRDNEGRYWLVAKGRNPTVVNGKELTREEPTEVAPDQKIAICNFVIRIQPK
jgi:FHA domain-containing protein